jgi:hypothetical protein
LAVRAAAAIVDMGAPPLNCRAAREWRQPRASSPPPFPRCLTNAQSVCRVPDLCATKIQGSGSWLTAPTGSCQRTDSLRNNRLALISARELQYHPVCGGSASPRQAGHPGKPWYAARPRHVETAVRDCPSRRPKSEPIMCEPRRSPHTIRSHPLRMQIAGEIARVA